MRWCTTRNRARLKQMVKALGGFPLVVRRDGFEGGIGVMLAESWPTFFPLVDFFVESGQQPTLARFVPDAVHWRLVVVGDAVVASYPNPIQPGDFRSYADDDPEGYAEPPPAAAVQAAVDATAALRLELGGCDVLVDADGDVHVLEGELPGLLPAGPTGRWGRRRRRHGRPPGGEGHRVTTVNPGLPSGPPPVVAGRPVTYEDLIASGVERGRWRHEVALVGTPCPWRSRGPWTPTRSRPRRWPSAAPAARGRRRPGPVARRTFDRRRRVAAAPRRPDLGPGAGRRRRPRRTGGPSI